MNLNAYLKAEIQRAPIVPFIVSGVVRNVNAGGTIVRGREEPYRILVYARNDGPAERLTNDMVSPKKVAFGGSEDVVEELPSWAPEAAIRAAPIEGRVRQRAKSRAFEWKANRIRRLGKQAYEARPELYDEAWELIMAQVNRGRELEDTIGPVVDAMSRLPGRTREESRQVVQYVLDDVAQQWDLRSKPRGGRRRSPEEGELVIDPETGNPVKRPGSLAHGRSRGPGIRPSYVNPDRSPSRLFGEGQIVAEDRPSSDVTGVSPAMTPYEFGDRQLLAEATVVASQVVDSMDELPSSQEARSRVVPLVVDEMRGDYPSLDEETLVSLAARAVALATGRNRFDQQRAPREPRRVLPDDWEDIPRSSMNSPEQGNYSKLSWDKWFEAVETDRKS